MQGARWDDKVGTVEELPPKSSFISELYDKMPIVGQSVSRSSMLRCRLSAKNCAGCSVLHGREGEDKYPTYKTQDRRPTFIFEAGLKTKAPASKWILGDVGVVMDVEA